jgi:predicted HicB family RNase H-like nuclease
MAESKQKRLVVLLDSKTHQAIHLAAVRQETSVSEIVRQLLSEYLASYLDQFTTPEASHDLQVQE